MRNVKRWEVVSLSERTEICSSVSSVEWKLEIVSACSDTGSDWIMIELIADVEADGLKFLEPDLCFSCLSLARLAVYLAVTGDAQLGARARLWCSPQSLVAAPIPASRPVRVNAFIQAAVLSVRSCCSVPVPWR